MYVRRLVFERSIECTQNKSKKIKKKLLPPLKSKFYSWQTKNILTAENNLTVVLFKYYTFFYFVFSIVEFKQIKNEVIVLNTDS